MTKGYTRDAQASDIDVLARDLRDADKAEILAASGSTPAEALEVGLIHAQSDLGVARVACLPDGTPVAIYGVASVAPGLGAIWMVATNQFHKLHRQFLRECRSEIAEITSRFDLVYNYTDARNEVHHRWIKWAGFKIIKRHESFGVGKVPFLEFVLIPEK